VSTAPFAVVPVLVGGAAKAAEANASYMAAASAVGSFFMVVSCEANWLARGETHREAIYSTRRAPDIFPSPAE
jgi:isopentenyl diphosphate isomerase/L-lactate dehydrogenase-like FMN-dependent dehydrogenase